MNLLLIDPEEVGEDGLVRLGDGRRGEHLRKVLKARPGQRLRAGVVGGMVGHGEVLAVADHELVLRLEVPDGTPPRPDIDLVLALPRPQVLHRVLQFAAAMGVGHIDFVKSWRVEKSYFGSPSLRPERVQHHLRLGAEQGMTTWLPEVSIHPRLMPFVDQLAETPTSPHLRLLAHPEASDALETLSPLPSGRWQLAIGPEGGWIDREVETFTGLGFRPVHLGPWILRVEAAMVALLAQVALLRRLARPASAPGSC